jgi:hypothetical protein
MNKNSNEPFASFTVKLTKAGMMTTTADELEILEAGTELTVKDIRERAKAGKEEYWAQVTVTKDGKAIDGFIPLELLQSFAGLLPDDPAEEEIRDYPRCADCPSLLEFPLMRQVFGPTQVGLGQTRAELGKVLSRVGKTGRTPTGMRCEVQIEAPIAFDVSSVILDFESDMLVRCRITYQYDPIGSIPLSKLKHEVYSLLGSPDGYVEDSKGNKHRAWRKKNILIAVTEEPTLCWYAIEFFREVTIENQTPQQQLRGLRVEKGLTVPPNLIRLLTADITGISPEDPRTVDAVFAEMVMIGPMFFKRFLASSVTEQKADRAMLRIDSEVYEGRVLMGVKRLLALADPQFESAMCLYRDGLLRNATDEERLVFYRIIDFEIKGKPVYIIESKAGRLLVYLDEETRIKWIEYFDDWRKPQMPSLGRLFG